MTNYRYKRIRNEIHAAFCTCYFALAFLTCLAMLGGVGFASALIIGAMATTMATAGHGIIYALHYAENYKPAN